MVDFGFFTVRTDIFVSMVSLILLSVQIVMCCNVKNKTVKLIPVFIFSLLTLIFVIIALLHTDWDRFAYFVLAVFSAILLIVCGIGWLVYWLISYRKQK